MIRASTFSGKTVAVFGLGTSGLATAQALLAGGATVAAWDDGASSRSRAEALGIPVVDLASADWTAFDALALAPGVPLTHPAPHWTVEKAHAADVEVIGDVEIFFRERARHCPTSAVVAITGTNGKSTTTALLSHMLREIGTDVQMGGNIGTAVLSLEPPTPSTIHVLELSSFQIDLTPSLAPTVGVLLNVSPDHIDRHGTFEHYAAIKERLVSSSDAAAVGADDETTRGIIARLIDQEWPVYAFTAGRGSGVVPRLYAIATSIFAHEKEGAYASSSQIADLDGIGTLRGLHNVQNTLAALTALRALQDRFDMMAAPRPKVWRPEPLAAALDTFPGLAHRMEEVGNLAVDGGHVLFINDSKATNADSTEKALASFPADIFWIAGGKAKAGGIAGLAGYFPRIAKAYLIGEAAAEFAATLGTRVAHETSGTLEAALAAATRDARARGVKQAVVLLSPACASYDQFRSFEHRGDVFRDLVRAIPGVAGNAS